jgi:RNA polymerase sigma factor (sigma-70 family)
VSEEDKARRFQENALPHLNAAYNLARWLVRNDQDAEDVVQEAYLRAYRFFDGFRGDTGRAWLLAIVRNTCYTWMQQNREQQQAVEFDENCHSLDEHGPINAVSQALDNPEAILTRLDDARQLDAALQALPLEFREVLVMRELEELSYKEIASIASVPIGTVMSRLARGRKLLLLRLKQLNGG